MSDTTQTMVVLTTGKHDRGARATLAFSWACSALALGKKTSIFLTMDGTIWAMRGSAAGVQVDGFEPLANYVETFLSLGGEMMVCAPCTEYYCAISHGTSDDALIDGADLAGLATVVAKAGTGCNVVTF